MSNINGLNNNLPAHNHRKDYSAGKVSTDRNGAGPGKSADITMLQTNKLLIELSLNIKVESKYNFTAQAAASVSGSPPVPDLSQFIYNGKPVTELSQDEAAALVGEGGYFSAANTAQRIFDFAVTMAGDDLERLKAVRDAVIKGFKEAEEIFGGTLPGISYETIDNALKMIDEKIRGLGGSVIDATV